MVELLRVLLVAGIVSLGVTACRSGSDASVGPAPSKVAATPARSSAADAEPEKTLQAAAFDFSYHSRLTIRGQKLLARLAGTLSRSEPWKLGESWFRTYQVSDSSVDLSAGGEKKTEVAGVDEPFIVSVGRPLKVAFAHDSSAGARQLLSGLAAALQVHVPEDEADATEWTLEEQDTTGSYLASYARGRDGWIEKRKAKYLGETAPFAIDKSSIKARLAKDGSVSELSVSEDLSSKELSLEYTTTLVFGPSKKPGAVAARAVARFPEGYDVQSIIGAGGDLPGAKVEDLAPEMAFLEAFQGMLKSGAASLDAPTLLAVTTRLKRHPKEVEQVVAKLQQHPEQAAMLTALLVAVDGPEARAAVRRVLADPKQPLRVRVELLASLLLQGHVDAELLQTVGKLAASGEERLAIAAINVEGELIRRAAEGGTVDVAAFRKAYLERATKCAPVERCAAYVAGTSYIGTEEALAFVREQGKSKSVELRLAALRALESVKDGRVDGWIIEMLGADADTRVKDRAIKACSYRGSSACAKALGAELAGKANPNERMKLLQALGGGRFPAATSRPAITRLAKQDADPKVRAFANQLLERMDQK